MRDVIFVPNVPLDGKKRGIGMVFAEAGGNRNAGHCLECFTGSKDTVRDGEVIGDDADGMAVARGRDLMKGINESLEPRMGGFLFEENGMGENDSCIGMTFPGERTGDGVE